MYGVRVVLLLLIFLVQPPAAVSVCVWLLRAHRWSAGTLAASVCLKWCLGVVFFAVAGYQCECASLAARR